MNKQYLSAVALGASLMVSLSASAATQPESVAAADGAATADAGAATAAATDAPASDASAPADDAIETVVVTARKRAERLQDVPVAVTAISGEALEEQHITQAKDIAALTPGLNITSDSVSRSFVDIRGVGTTLIDTVQPGVGIFLDGVYQPNTSYLNTPLLDVDRIEVLRGPQGTLFGQNTLGGAINIITRQPTDQLSGKLTGSLAGPDDYRQLAGSISGALVPGVLRGRLGAAYQHQDGFLDNTLAGGDANPLDQKAVNGALIYEPIADARFTLSGYYNRVFGGSTPYADVTGPTDYSDKVTTNENSLTTLRYSGGNLKSEFELAPIASKLTVLTAYDVRSGEGHGDGDYGPYDVYRVSRADTRFHTTTGELRLDTHYAENLSSLFGVFADRNIYGIDGELDVVTGPGTSVPVPSQARIETGVYALYGTMFWNPTQTTELTAGLRYDHQHVVASGDSTGQIKASELEPRLTFKKNWTPDTMSYASVSRGFRGGGVNPPGSPNPTYQGDSVWTYELGSKLSLLDRHLNLDVAAFYNDYRHFIGQNALAPSTLGAGFVAVNLNTGTVHSPGIEAQLQGVINPHWTVNGGLTYLHSRISDASEYEDTTGKQIPSDRILFLPDWSAFAGTRYSLDLLGDKLIFDVNATYKGARNGSTSDPNSVPRLKDYTLLNGAITWRAANWEVALWGSNLTDEKYFSSYIDRSILEQAGLVGPLSTDVGIIGDGRRVGIRVGTYF
ncbi:TonB-dependent receptor [Solimonas terrae]|uniref:TonB-dependent receptor n=1 Tax=Solimonas terrae TaxID=1396819 RepID=A0A6M2BUP9_9GAMM|nr:TonB-dependent receptor [Solimonas terrae]NGY05843.1 TonB-dependent receptor [Solimonas terrae]